MTSDGYSNDDKFIGRGLDAFGLKTELLKEIDSRKDTLGLSLLEIGCGKGNLLLNLATLYPDLNLTGINKSPEHGLKDQAELNEHARQLGLSANAERSRLHFQIAEATNLPSSASSLDIVISHVTFLHIENKAKALEGAYRVLKPKGVALISLGGYSILRKLGHPMPKFYKSICRKIGTDFNPRFLIMSKNKYIPLTRYVKLLQTKHNIELKAINFVSESQRGIAHWIIIRKNIDDTLDLGLKYLPEDSQKLTELYAKNNPVNWGAIDKYELSST